MRWSTWFASRSWLAQEAAEPSFVEYATNVKSNCKALADALIGHGYSIVTGGTDNHLLMWDVRPQGLNGGKMEWLYEQVHISVNKNTVYGDSSALTPGGVRLGAAALTSRGILLGAWVRVHSPAGQGFTAKDFNDVAQFLHRGIQIAVDGVTAAGKNLKATTSLCCERRCLTRCCSKEWKVAVSANPALAALAADVQAYSEKFSMPGRAQY